MKDEVQIRAFEIAAEHKYNSCANSIIGMPDETRDLIFDTINFVRKLPESVDATGAFIFAPFHGTPLRDLAIKKGYIKEELICTSSITNEIFSSSIILKLVDLMSLSARNFLSEESLFCNF